MTVMPADGTQSLGASTRKNRTQNPRFKDGDLWPVGISTFCPPAATLPPARWSATLFDAQGTQHVDYIGADGDVHELWWDSNG